MQRNSGSRGVNFILIGSTHSDTFSHLISSTNILALIRILKKKLYFCFVVFWSSVLASHLVLFFVARCHIFRLLSIGSFIIDKSVKKKRDKRVCINYISMISPALEKIHTNCLAVLTYVLQRRRSLTEALLKVKVFGL